MFKSVETTIGARGWERSGEIWEEELQEKEENQEEEEAVEDEQEKEKAEKEEEGFVVCSVYDDGTYLWLSWLFRVVLINYSIL